MESVPESPRSRLHTLAHLESKTVSGLWHRVSCKKLLRRIFGLERELQKKELCESNTNTVKKRMSGMEMSQGGQAKIKVIGEASAIASNLEKLEKGKRLKDSKDSKGLNTPKEKSRFEKLPRELRDEIYRIVLVTEKSLAADTVAIHCKGNGCGTSIIRERTTFERGLFGVNVQIADEASLIMYGENTFAIEEITWPTLETHVTREDNKHIIPTEKEAFHHRYTRQIKHLHLRIHLAPYVTLEGTRRGDASAAVEASNHTINTASVCEWYRHTLRRIVEHQRTNFPRLQSLMITGKDHGSNLHHGHCVEAFKLKLTFNTPLADDDKALAKDSRSTQASEILSPVDIDITKSPQNIGRARPRDPPSTARLRSQLHEKLLTLSETKELNELKERRAHALVAMEDPKATILIPLLDLTNVAKVAVEKIWMEKVTEKVKEGRDVEKMKETRSSWTFISVIKLSDWIAKRYIDLEPPVPAYLSSLGSG